MKKFFIGIYEYIFYSEFKKQQKRYWNEVRDNQKNIKWEYFDRATDDRKENETDDSNGNESTK